MTNCHKCIYKKICGAMIKPIDCMSFKENGIIHDGLKVIHPGDNQKHLTALYERVK